jgi:phage terminase large subunit-like protein
VAIEKFRALTEEELTRLSDEDLADYEENLEALYWSRGKDSFLDFCQMVDVPGAPMGDEEEGKYFPTRVTPAAHHRLLIDGIQKMTDGTWHDVDGIMAFMPPGSAKSTYLSVLAPAWVMGRKPGVNVISTSYGQELANRFGRRVRQIVRSPEFSKIMGCSITGDNQAVDNWSLTSGSDFRAAGMGAAVTGFRSDFAGIDDPIRGREDADSQLIRDKIWASFNDDIATRMKPRAKLCLAMTRWHEDDPASRLLGPEYKGQSGLWRGTDGRLWYIINLPLFAEHKDDPLGRAPGELLWAEWFDAKEANRLREAAKRTPTAARTFSALYQQRPAPDEGAILAKHYWKQWKEPEMPEVDEVFLCYDTAFEEDESADFSAMTAWGVFEHTSRKKTGEEYKHRHVILLGAWKDQISAVDLLDKVKEHYRLFRPHRILIEKRASGIQLIQEMHRLRMPVKAWLPPGRPGAKGKVPRCHSVATILEQGSVWYVSGSRTEAAIEEAAAAPYGRYWDWTDTITMALSYFRDKHYLQTADDELDIDELKERLSEQASAKRQGRRLYGDTRAQGLVNDPIESDDVARMTEPTKRRLYGVG